MLSEPDEITVDETEEYFSSPEDLGLDSAFYSLTGLCVCPRGVYYDKTERGGTDKPSRDSQIIMEYGNELHQVAYRRIDRWGMYHPGGEERKYSHPISNVSFIVDKFIYYNDKLHICEVKTVSEWAYKGSKDKPGCVAIPKPHHYNQLQFEMNLHDLPGVLHYMNRSTGKYMFHKLEKDEGAFKEIMIASASVTAGIDEGQPPDRPFTCIIDKDGIPKAKQTRAKVEYKSDWQCFSGWGWCKHLSRCWANQGINADWRRLIEEKKRK